MFLYCLKLSCNDIAETLSLLHKKIISHHTVGNILRSKLFDKLNLSIITISLTPKTTHKRSTALQQYLVQ